ncbi:hypothetical protein VTI74DRAFT_3590 [Chaetomium olivicolor]
MARVAAALPAPASIVAVLALIGTLIPSVTNAAYVQWIPCADASGGAQGSENLWPTSNRARLLPSYGSSGQGGARLELDVHADYVNEATCAELWEDGPPDMTITLDALDLSKTYFVRPSNWTCLQYTDRPAWEQKYLADRGSQIRLVAQLDLDVLGLLPTFAVQVSFLASNKSDSMGASSACIYSEITPQLRNDVSTAVRYGPIAVFLLVFVSGLLATVLAPTLPARGRPSAEAARNGSHHHESILPGVADCLLHLQFIFFLGSLTLRYPGFYQPVTSLFHWSALFSPTGPFGQDRRYNAVNDGIYEINGTLTGSYGLELMSQITGSPMTMDVWWNMVVIVATITAVVAVLILVYRFISQLVPSLRFSLLGDKGLDSWGPVSNSAIAYGTWNVLRVVLSYFLTPIVTISAYQLDNVFLPAYHLALAALLIVLVVIGLTWMWRIAPSNQLWVLLLDSSKRYRLVRRDDPDINSDVGLSGKNRNIFAVIIFALAFSRGIAIGGFQFSPLAQVVGLAGTELVLLVSTAVLRPLRRRALSLFVWSGVARLVVIALTAVFLPELDASISVRSRVAIAILAINAAVLVLGCAVPATIRLTSFVYLIWAPTDKPPIYGLSQLKRRHDAATNLSINIPSNTLESIHISRRTNSLISDYGHSPHSRSDVSSISFYLDRDSSPSALYLQAVSQQHYFRPPRFSASTSLNPPCATSSSIISPLFSTNLPTSESVTSSPQRDASPIIATTATTTTTINISPSTSTWEKPQESSAVNSNGTVSDTAEPSLLPPAFPMPPPLAPQWSDYSFREADLYYGHARLQCDAEDFGIAATAPAPQHHLSSTVRYIVPSKRGRLTGWKLFRLVERQPAPHKGFEVRRPPKPAGV